MWHDWWDISKRLRRFLMTSSGIYGYKWSAQCGNWVIVIVRLTDVYKTPDQLLDSDRESNGDLD